MAWERSNLLDRAICQCLHDQCRTTAFKGDVSQFAAVWRPCRRHQWFRRTVYYKLVVAVVVSNAQLIREFTAVSLHDISNTGTERAFNTGQLFKYFVAGSMSRIT